MSALSPDAQRIIDALRAHEARAVESHEELKAQYEAAQTKVDLDRLYERCEYFQDRKHTIGLCCKIAEDAAKEARP